MVETILQPPQFVVYRRQAFDADPNSKAGIKLGEIDDPVGKITVRADSFDPAQDRLVEAQVGALAGRYLGGAKSVWYCD